MWCGNLIREVGVWRSAKGVKEVRRSVKKKSPESSDFSSAAFRWRDVISRAINGLNGFQLPSRDQR